jgi:hypothetical protein
VGSGLEIDRTQKHLQALSKSDLVREKLAVVQTVACARDKRSAALTFGRSPQRQEYGCRAGRGCFHTRHQQYGGESEYAEAQPICRNSVDVELVNVAGFPML